MAVWIYGSPQTRPMGSEEYSTAPYFKVHNLPCCGPSRHVIGKESEIPISTLEKLIIQTYLNLWALYLLLSFNECMH